MKNEQKPVQIFFSLASIYLGAIVLKNILRFIGNTYYDMEKKRNIAEKA